MTTDAVPLPSGIATALLDHVRRTPDRLAAWDVDRAVTYAELDALVGALAHRLAERRDDLGGCGVLPLLVGRDLGSLVAIQAAIRAGVAYAPIDAGLAPAALAALLRRIDDPRFAVVARADVTSVLPAGVEQIPALGETGSSIGPVPVDGPSLSRLIFTSGSSGEPKGVAVSWAAADQLLGSALIGAPPGADDYRALGIAPMSFVAGLVTAIRPSVGVAVSIVDPNTIDPVDLLERIDVDRLNTVGLVPSHLLTVLSRWPEGRRLESVRSITAYGEPLEWSTVPLMRRLVPDTAVIANAYGATEGGRPGMAMLIDSAMPLGVGRVPLGRPIDPTAVRLEPVPDADDLREVVLLGESVAFGYWRDPELTARSFGTDPDGTRFWRSGDLVRVDDAGLAHIVGRRDNVTKINGKLVEPSEPERVLGSVPGISRAVVLVQPAPRGGQRLVAHVEVEPGAPVRPADVRAAVGEQVAAHLVPAIIVRYDHLPVTDRGKVDRQALLRTEPVPWYERASDRPATLNEAAVLAVAGEILGFDPGPDDDLWDLGLDSLGATELLSTLEDYGWEPMPESALLVHRTAAAIAASRGRFVPSGGAIWLNEGADGVPVVCVLGPSSDALTFRRLAQELAPDHPVGILRQFDPLTASASALTVPHLAAAVLRDAAARAGDRPIVVVGYSASGVVAYEVARQRAADGGAVRVVLLDAPAGAATSDALRDGSVATASVGRRLRRGARQALVRALPPATMPQRERAFALFDLASKAASDFEPPTSDVPVTLVRATRSGLPDLAGSWGRVTTDLAVVDVDCDHDTILATPYVGVVAERIRELAVDA